MAKKSNYIIYSFREHEKLFEAYSNLSVRCPYCSHTLTMFSYVDKLICSWCGHVVYNDNDLGKKREFKDNLKKAQKKIQERERMVEKNEND